MKILVADDSKTNLAIISLSLKKLGHEVMSAVNAEEAIELFKKSRPDLIILDVVMEGVSGFECAARIREICIDDWIPIIFLSASVDDESIARGLDAGGDDYLTKPFSPITLAAKLKAMQRISDMRQTLYEAKQQLTILSSTDALTGLYNRLQFNRTICEKIAHSNRHYCMFALMYLDLDHFKAVNDSLGHQVGDLLLKSVAKRLQSCLRLDDFIARMGGDEFAIILNEIDSPKVAEQIAEKIIKTLAPIYNLDGNEITMSSSIGIACYPLDANNEVTLCEKADIAMYYAKELGRNNYQTFNEELSQKRKNKLKFEEALKLAVNKKQLFLTYQPIFDLKTLKIIGVEAQVNWQHPEQGIIDVANLQKIAEDEPSLLDKIGNWAIHQACLQGSKWIADGASNVKISLTVFSHQLLQKDLVSIIRHALEQTHFPADKLELEFNESALMVYEDFTQIMQEIKKLGIHLSLDNFGIGHSSLDYLRKLPLSTIKIDKSFVQAVTNNSNDSLIVRSIVSLGKNLGLNVIADGIDSQNELQFLIECKCPQGQGLFLSPTLTHDKIAF